MDHQNSKNGVKMADTYHDDEEESKLGPHYPLLGNTI